MCRRGVFAPPRPGGLSSCVHWYCGGIIVAGKRGARRAACTIAHLGHRRLWQQDAADALGGRDDPLDEDAVEEGDEALGHGACVLRTAKARRKEWDKL